MPADNLSVPRLQHNGFFFPTHHINNHPSINARRPKETINTLASVQYTAFFHSLHFTRTRTSTQENTFARFSERFHQAFRFPAHTPIFQRHELPYYTAMRGKLKRLGSLGEFNKRRRRRQVRDFFLDAHHVSRRRLRPLDLDSESCGTLCVFFYHQWRARRYVYSIHLRAHTSTRKRDRRKRARIRLGADHPRNRLGPFSFRV